ncbi:MAG: HAMP domain-containing sensor histidine kinase [Pseudoflavonifractor sp.]
MLLLRKKWLRRIGAMMRQVVEEPRAELNLPMALAPLEKDLYALQAQLRARQSEAEENEQRKNDLVAFLAHDLKTPLTSVVGYLQLLRDEPGLDPAQRAKYTGIALEKSQRLQELLGEFFDITLMDLGHSEQVRKPIQLTVLLEQLADEFYPLFGEKDLKCTTDLEAGLVLSGDPDKLARVFDNVLRNAVSYSTPGGTVALCAKAAEGGVEVCIRNEGLEIPEGELAHIFQKFYRLDAARSTRTGGAGLGLAIAREIVERHGGSIHAECNGKITSFIIRLPL